MNAGQKQMLAIVGLIGAVVLAVWLGWRGATSANSNGGFKPAPVLSRAQQIADAEKNVKFVTSDPNMSDQAKQIAIGMIRAHEPRVDAKGSP
jgi:hypothetical protein